MNRPVRDVIPRCCEPWHHSWNIPAFVFTLLQAFCRDQLQGFFFCQQYLAIYHTSPNFVDDKVKLILKNGDIKTISIGVYPRQPLFRV
jgi:hypothetical protein